MDTANTLLELLKYTVPSLVVLGGTYFIVDKFVVSEVQRKQLAIFHDSQDTTLRLRLQAYERLVLFIERISPRQLLPRIYDSSMTVFELQQAIAYTINTEFEHNLSQQLYVSKNAWETVKGVKEQEINMAIQVAKRFDQDAPAKELYTQILNIVLQVETPLPTEVALTILNEEVRKVMQIGSY
jgi:hypothetical protein